MSIDLSPAYFNLQLRFADSIARVSHFSFEEAILSFTNIYLQCFDRSFDPTHPTWQTYLEGLHQAPDQAQWTFSLYESRREAAFPFHRCFQYAYLPDEQVIHFHFTNGNVSGYGPLSKERRPARLLELKTMFAEVKQQQPDAKHVQGCSWLYNLDAYKRLFPPQYTSSMEIVGEEFQFLALRGASNSFQEKEPFASTVTRASNPAIENERPLSLSGEQVIHFSSSFCTLTRAGNSPLQRLPLL